MRETQNGQEEKNFNVMIFMVEASNWVGNQPAAPFNLAGANRHSNQVFLTWQYAPDATESNGDFMFTATEEVAR